MKETVTITVKPEQEKNTKLIQKLVLSQVKKRGSKTQLVFVKRSVDARHGQVKLHMRYDVYIDEEPPALQSKLPVWKKADGKHTVVIIGSGPAGLFGALKLLEYGIKPIIIERGPATIALEKAGPELFLTENFTHAQTNAEI